MKKIYYTINCEEAEQLNLSGNAMNVYFFIKAFKGGLAMGLDIMAGYLRMSRRALAYALKELEDRGLIKRTASEQVYRGGRVTEYIISQPSAKSAPGAKSAPNPVQDLHAVSAKSALGECKICTGSSAKSALGLIYNDTSNSTNNITNNIQGEEAPSKNSREIILSGVVAFYEKNGRVYIPDFRIETTAASELAAKIEMAMKADGWALDGESMAAWWAQFLQAGYATADAWMREHYDIKNINSQFNSIYQNIKNGKLQQAAPKKGERRVTDDHIAELIRQANGAI